MSRDQPLIAHVNLARGFRGGERQTELLVRGLAEAGIRQRVVVRRGEPLEAQLNNLQPGTEIVGCGGNVLGAALALRGADLVHVHEARALQAAWLNSVAGGAPYLVTRRVQQGPSHNALNRAIYARAARRVALSSAIAGSLLALDPRLASVIIPSASAALPIDAERVAALRERFKGRFLVGHIGALVDSHKGQRQIIAMARELAAVLPDIHFLLIGSGRDAEALAAEAAGLPNVEFTGEVTDVGNWLAALDIFLYPSRHEGLGSILLDAMAAGLPLVATRAGGIPEVVDSRGGFLCNVDDIAGLSAAIMTLHADAELRARMGTWNRERARDYSPAGMTARYLNLYRELLPGLETAGQHT